MSRRSFNVLLATGAVLLFLAHLSTTGLIPVDDGLGWDGGEYANMITAGFDAGTPNTRLRPLVIYAARVGVWVTNGDVVMAFRILDCVSVFALALAVSALTDAYVDNAARGLKAYVIASVFTSIAAARMFAFYPVLVDLGAYAIICAAVLAAVARNGWLAGSLAVLAAMSREFGVMAAVFGVHRSLRLGVPWPRVITTYAPALGAAVIVRLWATSFEGDGAAVVSMSRLFENLAYWTDPLYAAFFLYFGVTVFGGITAVLAARPTDWVELVRKEPEWLTYSVPILAVSAMGSADLWRYLAYLLPLVVVAFAQAARNWTNRRMVSILAIAAAFTWYTQRPFERVDLVVYFRDWFPYYQIIGNVPIERGVMLWPGWAWRFLVAAAGVWVLASISGQPRANRE